jgi:DNA-binding MarR family transcriptional regulator
MAISDGDLEECLDCLCLASRRAARAITRAFDRKLRPVGLRSTQFSLLAVLAGAGPRTIGDLAELLGIERTTLTRNLALLEGRRWVEVRTGDVDARERKVSATAAGRAVVKRALPAWKDAQRAMTAALGEAGATALRDLSHRSSR